MIRQNTFKALFVFCTAFEFIVGTFVAFLPVFAGIYLGLNTFQIAVLFTANIVAFTLAVPFTGRLADKLNRRFLVVIGALVSFGCLALFPLTQTFGQLLCLVVVRGLGGAVSLPAVSALVVGEGRRYGMGQAMAIISVATAIGLGIGPIVSGAVADVVSISATFWFAAGVGALGTAAFFFLSRYPKMASFDT